jgi:hypothetical protein
LGELPRHNTLGFFCWGRSLKIRIEIKRELLMYQPTHYITAYYYFWPPPSGKRKEKKCHMNFSKKVISCEIFCIFLVPLQDIIMEGLLGST